MSTVKQDSDITTTGGPAQLRLNTPKNARRTLARIIRIYNDGAIDEVRAKTSAYLLTQLLGFFKFEKGLEIEERLAALEERIDGGKQ